MKLSLLTYLLGKDMDLGKLLEVTTANGIPGIEFRAELGHKHGVELEASPSERAEIRKRCEDAGVAVCSIANSCRFESLDKAERQENVDRAKRYIDLADDVGAPHVRVFGNSFGGNDEATVVANVGACLRQIAQHAEGSGVVVGLEMHGDFYRWQPTLEAVQIADHPHVGIVPNCDPRELQHGPITDGIPQVLDYVRHVHIHDLESGKYPYKEFFGILKAAGYDGYMSLECSESPDAERVIGLYAALFREIVASA